MDDSRASDFFILIQVPVFLDDHFSFLPNHQAANAS
jgi:hypothetical protein